MIVELETGETKGLPCKSWRCAMCSVTNRRAFVKRLLMGLEADESGERPKLLTLTSCPTEHPAESRRRLTLRFRNLRRHLGRAFPAASLEYLAVVERTQRGAIHLHVIVLGMPFVPQAVLSRLAERFGFGRILDVREVRGGRAMGTYLTKALGSYLTKQATGSWPPHFRRIRFSQAYSPGWVARGRRPRQPGRYALVRIEPWQSPMEQTAAGTSWRSAATLRGAGPPGRDGPSTGVALPIP